MLQSTIFLREIVNFLRSTTIKNTYIADLLKQNYVNPSYIADLPDAYHPYYLHINGDYILESDITSSYYTKYDTMMYVTSFDLLDNNGNLKIIPFDKDNLYGKKDPDGNEALDIPPNPKTLAAYRLPNERYFTLCAKYPDQGDLIKAIVYPIKSKSEAISAKNFSLLAYDEILLQESERASLVKCLNETLLYIRTRWDVKEFCYEDYFPVLQWPAILYSLISVLYSQRIVNLHTINVHPMQIWEYLLSKGLKDYRTILSMKQQLFLYKNIDYLLKNKGKNSNLTILADNLLKEYGVEMHTKSLVQNTLDGVNNCLASTEIISEAIEQNDNTPTENAMLGIESVSNIIDREHTDGLEPSNSSIVKAEQKLIFDRMPHTYLPTKLIELRKIPLNSRFSNMYFNFISHSLLYKHINGRLNFLITISVDGLDKPVTLTANEALALLIYSIGKERDKTYVKIPSSFEIRYALKEVVPELPETVTHYTMKIHTTGPQVEVDDHSPSDPIIVGNKINPVTTVIVDQPEIVGLTGTIAIAPYDGNSYVTYEHNDFLINSVLGEDTFNILKQVKISNSDALARGIDIDRNISISKLNNMFLYNSLNITSSKDLMELFDAQFEVVYKHLLYGLDSNDTLQLLAMEKLYDAVIEKKLFTDKPLITDYAVYNSYNDGVAHTGWLTSIPELNQLMTNIENSQEKTIAYGALANSIIDALIPLSNDKFILATAFDTTRYWYMKSLLIQLCSYNIAFIDTNRSVYAYAISPPVAARSIHQTVQNTSYSIVESPLVTRPAYTKNYWTYRYGFNTYDPVDSLQLDSASNLYDNIGINFISIGHVVPEFVEA